MTEGRIDGAQPDLRRLAEHLRVLANPNRLELLYALRSPTTVGAVELRPERVAEGENPDRPISHQAVRDHLAKLRSIGVVAIERSQQGEHVVDLHVLNHQRLFAIVEEMRSLGELRAPAPAHDERTLPGVPEARSERDRGPRFLLVRGQQEGRVFALRAESVTPGRGWVIGRKRGLAVSLDYDPFVSGENSEVTLDAEGFVLRDLRASRNGTLLNFKPLPRGGSARLASGDVVSVGRTSLVFRLE